MKKFLLTTVAAMTLSAPVWAQADLDTNTDGMLSIEELQAANPDITAEQFAALDADGDGALNADEVSAAQASGQLTISAAPAQPAE